MTSAEITEILEKAGIPSPKSEALILIEHFENISRAKLLSEPRLDFNSTALLSAVEKRASRYPLQYIVGKWDFCGLTFHVDEGCLIPRADTEIVVEEAVKRLKRGGLLLDLCTGSGCIPAAVLHLAGEKVSAMAVELSPSAVNIARKNLAELGLSGRCAVIEGDIRKVHTSLGEYVEKFDVITSNPPYVTAEEMTSLEPELSYEPEMALTDGDDGLSFYKDIIGLYRPFLKKSGAMILEHGSTQKDSVAEIAREDGMDCRTVYDYSGNPRVAVLTFK